MEKIYSQSRLKYVNLIVVFLLTFLLECAFQNKLIFLDIFFKENICSVILKNSLWILIFLIIIYLINYYFLERRSKEYFITVVYDNICKEIFNRFVKTKSTSHNLIRVSLLKVFDRESGNPYLKVVGRYQTKMPKRKSRIVFNAGEGCAGIAFETNYFTQKSISEYDHKNPTKYYEESEKVFSLSRDKAKKLNDKACDFLCLPVRFLGQDERWGVLSIDSAKQGAFVGEDVRKIEDVLSCFSVFLVL